MSVIAIAVFGLLYSFSILLWSFIKREFTTHVFIQIPIALGFYGQVLRLWLLEAQTDNLLIPIVMVLGGHIFFEVIWAVSYFNKSRGSNYFKYKETLLITKKYRTFVVILILTLIAMISWFILFAGYGGWREFIFSGMIDERLELFRGYGYLLVMHSLFLLANVIYFSFIVYEKERIKHKSLLYIGFALHTMLLWFSSIPLGQRGGIFTPIIYWFLIITTGRNKFNRKGAVLFALIVLVLINVLDVIRNEKDLTYKGTQSVVDVLAGGYGFSERLESYVQIYDGTPMKLDYQYGKTYLTLLTQFVPRKLWPDKWDPAGVLVTKSITADELYSMRSNTQPTIFGESFLNFSYIGVIVILSILGLFVGKIDRIRNNSTTMWNAVIYSQWCLVCFYLVNGDFVNTMFGGVIFWVVVLIARKYCSAKKIIGFKCTPSTAKNLTVA